MRGFEVQPKWPLQRSRPRSGRPPEHRLTKQPRQPIPTVLAGARGRQPLATRVGQAQRVIQLAVSQPPGIGGDRGVAKLQQRNDDRYRASERRPPLHPPGASLPPSSIPRKPLNFNLEPPQALLKSRFIRRNGG
jgi:hypothetical protein